MAKYDAEQLANAKKIVETLSSHKSPKLLLAAIETGLVESGLHNMSGGDRDSRGVFQQRPSQGWGSPAQVMDVAYAANKFADAFKGFDRKGLSAGEAAARTQRPAAEYRGRYQQRRGDALALLKQLGVDVSTGQVKKGGKGPSSGGVLQAPTVAAKLAFINQKNRGLNDLVNVMNSGGMSEPSAEKPVSSKGKKMGSLDSAKARFDVTIAIAKKYGLTPTESADYGGVHPVHVKGSNHYSHPETTVDLGGGTPEQLGKAAAEIDRILGSRSRELFYNGGGEVNRKNGKRVPVGFVEGHTDHIHFSGNKKVPVTVKSLVAALPVRVKV